MEEGEHESGDQDRSVEGDWEERNVHYPNEHTRLGDVLVVDRVHEHVGQSENEGHEAWPDYLRE